MFDNRLFTQLGILALAMRRVPKLRIPNSPMVILMLITSISLVACSPQVKPTFTIPTETSTLLPASTSADEARTTRTPATATVEATPIAELKGKFDVNGRSLYIQCFGTGSPTIILEVGESGTVWDFESFQARLAERTTTCAYDRANKGRSDSAPTPRTAEDVVEDLHALLAAAQVPDPYVLVGNSAGGLFVQLYARTYPEQVVGVVSMNPVPPAHPWLDEVSNIFTTEEYTDEEAYYHGQNGETTDYLTSSQQVADAPKPTDIPFEMIISTDIQCEGAEICLKSYAIYERIMQEVSATWPLGKFSSVVALHSILDDPEPVVEAIERIIATQ